MELIFDEIGSWSEIKLDIIKKYATAYSTIMNAKGNTFTHIYIDAFAGSGINLSKRTGDFVHGSPLNALLVQPPFREIYLIDLNGEKTKQLQELTRHDPRVTVYSGDCNVLLLKEIFSRVLYEDYKRGLCLLDPYGLHIQWEVIKQAGHLKTIDMFLNFPVMDMNRNALWRNTTLTPSSINKMTAFWGDDSWRAIAYKTVPTLFGEWEEKTKNEDIVIGFRERLKNVAGFKYVADPLPMKNSKGAIVYYLFFASQQKIAENIIKDIFKKFK
jgi:three-Cys-motif partner protein